MIYMTIKSQRRPMNGQNSEKWRYGRKHLECGRVGGNFGNKIETWNLAKKSKRNVRKLYGQSCQARL